MIKKHLSILFFFVLFLSFGITHAQANKFSLDITESWIIFDGNQENLNYNWLETSKSYPRTGFILNLKYNRKENKFYHLSEQGHKFDFSELISILIENIQSSNLRYSLLFDLDKKDVIYFNQEINRIEQEFKNDNSVNTNTIQNILKTGNLHLFSFKKFTNLHESVHYFYDYFEIHDLSVHKQIQNPNFVNAQASMIYGISFDNKNKKATSTIATKKRQRWQKEYLQHWAISGLQPIFIVSDSNTKSFRLFTRIADTPQRTNTCQGVVKINNMSLDYVYWVGDEIGKSYGHFSFPLLAPNILKPYRPGYSFTPKEIKVSPGKNKNALTFNASPLKLSDKLKLYLPFNQNNINEQKNINLSKTKHCEIITDRKRGSVLKVNRGGYVGLKTSDKYGIKDNSFTTAFWFKNTDTITHRHVLFGTNSLNKKEGIHIHMRKNIPYFGFNIYGISSQRKIEDSQWHHLAFTFDKTTHEKRIYIDGELSDIDKNSPSFLGSDTLFIGKCLDEVTKLSFYLDNFMLWNRALSESEIKRLQLEETYLLSLEQNKYKVGLIVTCAIILSIFLIFLFFYLRSKKTVSVITTKLQIKERSKNAIFFFGDFSVYDDRSNNIVINMPPLLKELFLLILIAHMKGLKGVTSVQLNAEFWGNQTSSKARNNRNVTLARLRKYLDSFKGMNIEYSEGNHFLNIDEDVFIDFIKAEQLANTPENIDLYYHIIKKGIFLNNIEYKWIEDYKEQKSSEIIQILSSGIQDSTEDHLTEHLCLYLLKMDDLNEYALKKLICIYQTQGKSNLIHKTYNNFLHTYQSVYGEAYKYSVAEFQEADIEA